MTPTVNPSSAPYPRALLGYDGTNFYVLTVDSSGHLQVDALSTALPTNAATATNQTTMVTALQLIDDLRAALASVATDQLVVMANDLGVNVTVATADRQDSMVTALELIDDLRAALESVATDRLQVRGSDQLISFAGVLSNAVSTAISGAGGFVASGAVPAGKLWKVTGISARDDTTAPGKVRITAYHDSVAYMLEEVPTGLAANDWTSWDGEVWLDVSDTIRVYFASGLAGDNCRVEIHGMIMTAES